MAVKRLSEGSLNDFNKNVQEIIDKINALEVPIDYADMNHSISQLRRIKRAVEEVINETIEL